MGSDSHTGVVTLRWYLLMQPQITALNNRQPRVDDVIFLRNSNFHNVRIILLGK